MNFKKILKKFLEIFLNLKSSKIRAPKIRLTSTVYAVYQSTLEVVLV